MIAVHLISPELDCIRVRILLPPISVVLRVYLFVNGEHNINGKSRVNDSTFCLNSNLTVEQWYTMRFTRLINQYHQLNGRSEANK